jgi:hypothetical protein
MSVLKQLHRPLSARVRLAAIGLTALLATSGSGCNRDPSVHLALRTMPPVPVTVTSEQVVLPVGIAVAVLATPTEDDSTGGRTLSLDLISSDPEVFGVASTLTEGVFVFYGVLPGSAAVIVRVNEKAQEQILVRVTQGEAQGTDGGSA